MGLFDMFDSVGEAQWKQKIQVDLKGADYNDTLITTTEEGIHIKPFYHQQSNTNLGIPSKATPTGEWYVSQQVYGGNPHAANKKVKDILDRGAQGAIVLIPDDKVDLEMLLSGLPNKGIQIHPQFLSQEIIDQIHSIAPDSYVHIDPIHHLIKTGNWYNNHESDVQFVIENTARFKGVFFNLTINTTTYQQAGANTVQELAYFLAHLNEYLNAVDQSGNIAAFAESNTRINIDTAIGSDYFMQIAKYRAYRILTRTLGEAYGLSLDAYVTASPSLRNKSILDYNVNMLRTTTECMSAILGGADTLSNLPYDAFFNKENEFGERIARNQLLLLKEEAYFNEVSNPASGAYYIEALTAELVDKSLNLFKEIEKGGGFITALHNGVIQRKIEENARAQQEKVDSGQKVLVGVNKYQDAAQVMKKEYDVLPFVKIEPRKTLIRPIIERRLAEKVEKDLINQL